VGWQVKNIALVKAQKNLRPPLKLSASFFYFSAAGRQSWVQCEADAGGVRRLLISILLIGGFGYEDL
jgi:hypothetical protein